MGFFDTLKKKLLKETSSKEQNLSNYGPTIFRYGKKGTKLGMEDVIKTKGSSMFNFEGKDGKFFGVSVLYEPKSKNYFYEIIGDQNSQRIKATTKAVLLRSISKKIENLGFKGRDLNGLLKGLSLNGEISTLFEDKEDFDIDVDIEKKKKKRLEKRKERISTKLGKEIQGKPIKNKNIKLRPGETLEEVEYGYNVIDKDGDKTAYSKDFEEKLFGGMVSQDIKKTSYGYSLEEACQSDGQKYAYGKDMQTKLFRGERFVDMKRTIYGYNLIDRNGQKWAYKKDMKTKLFDGFHFKNIKKTDYGYLLESRFGTKYAYKKDMVTELFDGLAFKDIEETSYGYNITNENNLTYAFDKSATKAFFGGHGFRRIEKTSYGYHIKTESWERYAFKKDMKTKLFGGLSFLRIEKASYGYDLVSGSSLKYAFDESATTLLSSGDNFSKHLENSFLKMFSTKDK